MKPAGSGELAQERLLTQNRQCREPLHLVIARNRDFDGGIGLEEWNAVVRSDRALDRRTRWCGTDPRTWKDREFPIAAGAATWHHPGGPRQYFVWKRGAVFAEDCDDVAMLKVQALARRLGAECFEAEDPPVDYQPGQCELRLGGDTEGGRMSPAASFVSDFAACVYSSFEVAHSAG